MFIFLKILEFEFTSTLFPVEPNKIKEFVIFVVTDEIFILLKSLILNNKILTFSKIVEPIPIFSFSKVSIIILLVLGETVSK